MAKQDTKSFFSDWLEKLQQESWQLELLISGLALFGIYESQDFLIELKMYAISNSEGITRVSQDFFLNILGVGWKIFFINLLIHVILRGLWIGAIGLRYVSHDIDYDALNYSEYFTEMLQKRVGGFDDFIERLEKICSVLFAYTFLLFLLFFSLAFFFFQIFILAKFISEFQTGTVLTLSFLLFLYVFLGFIVFIDFITLGFFKKIEEKSVNKIYGYIFTFYGWTTLTFLYRPLLYNFLDNRYTKRLFFFSFPYIIIMLLASSMFTNNNFAFYPTDSNAKRFGNTVDRMHYEDLRKEYMTEVDNRVSKRRQNIPSITLNKYLNNEDYLRIFLKMKPTDYKLIQKNTDLNPYTEPGLNFTLFSSNKHKDEFYKEGNDALNLEFDSLRTIKTQLRRNKRGVKDSIKIKAYDSEMDSITSYISKKRNKFKVKSVLFEEKKQTKIINAFLDLIELEINDLDVRDDLDCYFFRHQNNDEKGLMCLYLMDSLALGKQELYYFKKENNSDSNSQNNNDEIRIPFYKVRDFD